VGVEEVLQWRARYPGWQGVDDPAFPHDGSMIIPAISVRVGFVSSPGDAVQVESLKLAPPGSHYERGRGYAAVLDW